MKKFMLVGLLVCALLVVAACRSNNDAEDIPPTQRTQGQETQTSQPEDPPSQGQNETTSGTDTNVTTQPTSGSYYTFGDTINLWDEWEIIFFDNVIITTPSRPPFPDSSARSFEIYDAGVVKVPAILTNISDAYIQQGLIREYSVYGPGGDLQNINDLRTLDGLMWDVEIGRIPGIHQSPDAGESIEGYAFFINEGNGDYWMRWPDRLGGVQVRLPVSR